MGDRFYQQQIAQGRKPEKKEEEKKYSIKANHIFNDLVEPDTPKKITSPEDVFEKEVFLPRIEIPITAHGVTPEGEVIPEFTIKKEKKTIQLVCVVCGAGGADTEYPLNCHKCNGVDTMMPKKDNFPTNEELQKLKVNHIEDYQDINYAGYNTEKMKKWVDSEYVFDNPEGVPLERSANDILAERLAKRATKRVEEKTPINTEFRLYELTPLVEALIMEGENYASEHDGELPIDLCEALEHLEMKREEKKINIGLLIKDYLMKKKILAEEIKSLQARKKSMEGSIEQLTNYLQKNMKYGEKVNDERIKSNWRRNTSCVVFDVDMLPRDCYTLEKKPLIQDVIKPALKKGSSIEGAELQTTESFSIK